MANTAALKPVDGARIELDKRQHVPYRVIDSCPECKTENMVDLSHDRHGGSYLGYPIVGQPEDVYFCCKKCDHEWQVEVIVKLTLELVP